MDINTPCWEYLQTVHFDEGCALAVKAAEDPFGADPRRSTYGDVVSQARGAVPWCPLCGVKDNPAVGGSLNNGVGK